MSAIKFKNFSDEKFAHPSLGGKDDLCKYHGQPYNFPPGSEMYMEDDKALTLAKHLANRELYKLSRVKKERESEDEMRDRKNMLNQMSPDMEKMNDFPKFKELFYKAYIVDEDEPVKEGAAEKRVFCEFCDSLGHFHKLGCPVIEEQKAKKLEQENKKQEHATA